MLVEAVDVAPRGVLPATRVACRAPDTEILFVRNANQEFSFANALELAADGRQYRVRDVLEHLGAENELDRLVSEAEVSRVALYTDNSWMSDGGLSQIERDNFIETLGEKEREVAISGSNVERPPTSHRCETQKI
jgi:hypothetical protein